MGKKGRSDTMKKSTVAVLVSLITVLFIGCVFAQAKTPEQNMNNRTKCYKSIEIQAGDTLWSIAEEYMTEEYYSVEAYVKDVQEINGFNGNRIYEGCYLVVPYYSDQR